MRLINADKLIDNLDDMILADDGGDYAMGIATALQETGRMAVYEEVKAIPVEWLKRYEITKGQEVRLQDAINEWEKENATEVND